MPEIPPLEAASYLLPLVYNELRRLAAARLAGEAPGQTLDAIGLVHEAYLRLVGTANAAGWEGRNHFFGAAAEAMRRVLVDRARGKARLKRSSRRGHTDLANVPERADGDPDLILSLDEALTKLAAEDPASADVAKLHIFAGLPIEEAATVLNVSRATAYRNWTYARAWIQDAIANEF